MASILVVCTGNVCRSPIAEGLLGAELGRRFGTEAPTVTSAGTMGWEGSDAMPESVIAAAEREVDIRSHIASRLTAEMANDADLIVCMAQEHRLLTVALAPEAAPRTFTLKEVVRLLEALPKPTGSLQDRVEAADELRRDGFEGNPPRRGRRRPAGVPHRHLPRDRLGARRLVWEAGDGPLRPGPGHRLDIRGAPVRVSLGCDHAGFALKELLKGFLESEGHEVLDFGTGSEEPVDYPRFCYAAAKAVADGRADRGIVLGGSGQGEQIAANKVPGVRAALANDLYLARLSREHNDANILSMGGRIVAPHLAKEIAKLWLATPFEGGRHAARLEQVSRIERGEEP